MNDKEMIDFLFNSKWIYTKYTNKWGEEINESKLNPNFVFARDYTKVLYTVDDLLKAYNKLTTQKFHDKNNKSYTFGRMMSLVNQTDGSIPEQDKFFYKFPETEFIKFNDAITNFYDKVVLFVLEQNYKTPSENYNYYSMSDILNLDKKTVVKILKNPNSWDSFKGTGGIWVVLGDLKTTYSELNKKQNLEDCCHIKTTKKYTTRPGPPYSANEPCCKGKQKVGNDSNIYISTESKNGIWIWKKIKN